MRIVSVNTAMAQPVLIDGRRVATAIGKQPVAGPVAVQPLGLAGDEQADLSVHGGLAKAMYAYGAQHHALWQTLRAQARVAGWGEPLRPGLFGENLLVDELDETALWLGDRLHGPDCTLVVSEPRFPCFKFAHAMGFAQAPKMMVQSGTCGAYLAVLVPGTLAAGQALRLAPGPREVNLRELFRARMGRKGA